MCNPERVETMFASFNDGTRPAPAVPMPIAIRTVIQDMESGRIDTSLRFGRKNQWKTEQRQRYILRLLEGRFHPDPVAISRKIIGGRRVDRAINGNNRFRCVRDFRANRFGVPVKDDGGRTHTIYYSEIPAEELERSGRSAFVHVLPPVHRDAFDDYPLLFNVREGLTEQDEISWYQELNTNMVAHSPGHILVARLCAETENSIISRMLATFPVIKTRIGEPAGPNDEESLGAYLIERSGAVFNIMDERDKRENLLLSHTILFNLLANGNTFDEKFRGQEPDEETLERTCTAMRRILDTAVLSDDLIDEWRGAARMKPYQPLFWYPPYLLGPMAWSLATQQPGASDKWIRFLSRCVGGTIDAAYMNEMREKKYDDLKVGKYSEAYEAMAAWLEVNP
jgi:hypothetical protein